MFVCKNYRVEGGLSNRLHTVSNDLCQIKALMGKGLGIKQGGTHLAFTAGTGILPFIDLVALMVRANLGILDPEVMPAQFKAGSTFKFVLYVSFDSRKDALAMELLEGLYEITQKLGLKNFDLVIRLSSEKQGSRWNEEFIKRQFQIRTGETIEKVWVCGPPVMNELFDRTFESMINEGELKLYRQQLDLM